MMGNNNLNTHKPSITLALSGGGSRGVFHLGFIDALQKNGVKIKAISGTSAGSIAGAIISCGIKPKEGLEIFKSKEFKKIFRFNWLHKSIFTINLNSKLLDKIFIHKDLSNAKIPFFTCATDLKTHKVLYFNKGNAKKLLYASCALIPFFKPISYKKHLLVDGGFLDLMPVKPLSNFDYPILGINIMPQHYFKKYSLKTLFVKVFDLIVSKNLSQNSKKCTWYITPEEILNFRMLSFGKLQEIFDLGYKYGIIWCNENLKNIH